MDTSRDETPSLLGPTLIAQIRERSGHYTEALHVIAAIMLVSAVIPLLVRPLQGATSAFVPPYQPEAVGGKG